MTEDWIERIVAHLPEHQREEARYRIVQAHMDGVTDIGLWTGEEPADISDLTGNCPRRRAKLRAEGDEFSSGLIVGFGKYASDK